MFLISTLLLSHLFPNVAGTNLFQHEITGNPSLKILQQQYEYCRLKQIAQADYSDASSSLNNFQFDISNLRVSAVVENVTLQTGKVRLWPKNEIPIRLDFGSSTSQRDSLLCAVKYFHAYSCIKFVTWVNGTHRDYVTVTNKLKGCFSEHVGVKGGEQFINLNSHDGKCWSHGTIIHELLHVAGFFHEQARDDRDTFIHVHWENIPADENFIRQFNTTSELGIDQDPIGQYDYASIMHYKRSPFAKNKPTMSAKKPLSEAYKYNNLMGNRVKPTQEDTRKLNLLYNCPNAVDCEVSVWSVYGPCSVTCGTGSQTRTRSVMKPAVSHGDPCPKLNDMQTCAMPDCPPDKDCVVSEWSVMGLCSVSCGGGSQLMRRTVIQPPSIRGKSCPTLVSSVPCSTNSCPAPADCQVTGWHMSSSLCSVTCGRGTQLMSRAVLRHPIGTGKDCPKLNKTVTCNPRACPLDCLMSEWTASSPCTVTCGGGVQNMTRTIIRKAAHGGKKCSDMQQQFPCHVEECPGKQKYILISGGYTPAGAHDSMEAYDSFIHKPYPAPLKLEGGRWGHVSILLDDGRILVAGGLMFTEGKKVTQTTEILPWFDGPPMTQPRFAASGANFKGQPWICGGSNGIHELNSCEKLTAHGWARATHMQEARLALSTVVSGNELYVLGGWNGTHELKSMQSFNGSAWRDLAPMAHARSDLAGVAVNGSIFVCGGSVRLKEKQRLLSSCERYDISTNAWRKIASMEHRRHGFSLVSYDDKIYALGGGDTEAAATSIESYDIENDHWSLDGQLLSSRIGSSAVLFDLQRLNAQKFGMAEATKTMRVYGDEFRERFGFISSLSRLLLAP